MKYDSLGSCYHTMNYFQSVKYNINIHINDDSITDYNTHISELELINSIKMISLYQLNKYKNKQII